MMRKRIGWWLLVLAALVAPGAAHAQDLHRWPTPDWVDARPPTASNPTGPAWLDRWLAAASAPAPAAPFPLRYTVRAQDTQEGYFVPPVIYTGPLSHPRYEDGGLFVGVEFMYWRETRPILSQSVAFRGFYDPTGVISGQVGAFVGSHAEALNTNMVQGSGSYQPGLDLFMGYRFQNGVSVALEWIHLQESRYAASAGPIGPNFGAGVPNVGNLQENTFLFAPVSNWPLAYSGNFASVLVGGLPAVGATPGIWNAATEMTEQFLQRFELIQLNVRVPFWETSSGYRAYGTFGPRAFIMWEEYLWRTVQRDVVGQASADTSAQYTNITSNRLYGAYCGSGHDWYLYSSPVGAFAIDLQINGGLYMDFVKERAGYELGDKSTAAHRATNTYSVVPGFDGKIGLMWYPWEAIQVRFGYNFFGLFNTYASPRPIDFNFGTINPEYSSGHWRWIHGLDAGIAFVF
jgi:hypothetical protein